MNLEEIKQAITKLPPEELSRFRDWFRKYESNFNTGELNDSQETFEETLKRLRGSFKGKGVLKSLMEERRKETLL